MSMNVGSLDRIIRVVLGCTLLAFTVLDQTQWRWFGLAGVVLIFTAFVSFCPLYAIVGASTKRRK